MPIPPVPAPKAAVAPPIAAPKGKFDAMVPVLLILNTLLLVAILLVLLFHGHGH
jgi:hypothetical protein